MHDPITGVLEIESISHNVGSINGGAIVTIKGRGFATTDTVFSINLVSIGAFPAAPCRVLSSAWDEVVCQTEPAGRMHAGAFENLLLPVELSVNGASSSYTFHLSPDSFMPLWTRIYLNRTACLL